MNAECEDVTNGSDLPSTLFLWRGWQEIKQAALAVWPGGHQASGKKPLSKNLMEIRFLQSKSDFSF